MQADSRRRSFRHIGVRVAGVAIFLGLLQAAFFARNHLHPPTTHAAAFRATYPTDPAVVDFVGLAVGDPLYGGWVVEGLPPVDKGTVFVMVGKGPNHFAVGITRPGKVNGLIDTQRYALWAGMMWPRDVDATELQRVTEVVAQRLRERENAVPAPPGL